MGAATRTWRLSTASGPVDLVADPGDGEGDSSPEALRALRRIVYDFTYGDHAVRRTLQDVHRSLRAGIASPPADLDPGSPRSVAFCEDLLDAASRGRLVARPVAVRSVIVPLDLPSEVTLGPQSAPESAPPSTTWIGVTLADQNGTPVPGRAYRIIKPDGSIIDGSLDSNGSAIVSGLDPGSCTVICPYVPPRPATSYVVQEGDTISSIAQAFGYDDFSTLWNDPGNAGLQAQRPDPHVLQPGDELMIPDFGDQPGTSKPTGAKHPFSINTSPLNLRLKLLDLKIKPIAGTQASVDGTAYTSDGDGVVSATVAKSAQTSVVDLPAGQLPASEWNMNVGGLNPADDTSESGWRARLYNLGFLWDRGVQDDDGELVIALQDFQAEYSLSVTGQLDDGTKAKITEIHGC